MSSDIYVFVPRLRQIKTCFPLWKEPVLASTTIVLIQSDIIKFFSGWLGLISGSTDESDDITILSGYQKPDQDNVYNHQK